VIKEIRHVSGSIMHNGHDIMSKAIFIFTERELQYYKKKEII
jgi:hypothetical protein